MICCESSVWWILVICCESSMLWILIIYCESSIILILIICCESMMLWILVICCESSMLWILMICLWIQYVVNPNDILWIQYDINPDDMWRIQYVVWYAVNSLHCESWATSMWKKSSWILVLQNSQQPFPPFFSFPISNNMKILVTWWITRTWASYQIRKVAGCASAGNVIPATVYKGNRYSAIPACITARASRTCRDACRDR